MFGLGAFNVGRRLVESVVGLFAILGFLYVPLGHHTGFEHAKAVLSTPAAEAALADLGGAALGLRERVVELVTGHFGAAKEPQEQPSAIERKRPSSSGGPRPVPPKLK